MWDRRRKMNLVQTCDYVGICWHQPIDQVVSVTGLWSSCPSQYHHRQLIVTAVYSANDVYQWARRCRSAEQSTEDQLLTIRWLRQWTHILLVIVTSTVVVVAVVVFFCVFSFPFPHTPKTTPVTTHISWYLFHFHPWAGFCPNSIHIHMDQQTLVAILQDTVCYDL